MTTATKTRTANPLKMRPRVPPREQQQAAGRKGGATPPAAGKRRGLPKGAKMAKRPPPNKLPAEVIEAKKHGRPSKLQPDEGTVQLIESLSQIGCTHEEIAATLHVDPGTLTTFFNRYEDALNARERGQAKFKVSVRRKQFKLADTNGAVAIFLGKNVLGQRDDYQVTNEDGPAKAAAATDARSRALELIERLGLGGAGWSSQPGTAGPIARKLPGIPE